MREWVNAFNEIPYAGLDAESISGALSAINASDEIGDKRVVSLMARDDGRVFVKTGEMRGALSGGGQIAIVERQPNGSWHVTETNIWAS